MASQKLLHDWRAPVTARVIALWSLSLAAPAPLRASVLTAQAEVMGVEPVAMRMALGRLLRETMAVPVARGLYALGPAAAALHAKARAWAAAEARLRPWHGDWIVILADHLGRTDRRRVQARERALRLTGFAATGTGIWVRPDNLAADADALGGELRGLGLDPAALILTRCTAHGEDAAGFRRLWPAPAIERGYRFWLDELAASTARLPVLSTRDAAREAFLLGQSVIRAINSDPLLPPEMIDAGLRAGLIDTMKEYDAMARRIWAEIGQPVPRCPSGTIGAPASARAA